MAFRGVGGKKPDEGRGRWAESSLKEAADPSPVGRLANQFHDKERGYAFYWTNQILELTDVIDEMEEDPVGLVSADHRDNVEAEIKKYRQLITERNKFDALCRRFCEFLQSHAVQVMAYSDVFGPAELKNRSVSQMNLDLFLQETVIPSEDFEIVYAAMTIPCDLFVTDDKRLITCAWSLGLNFPISVENFCSGADYAAKVQHLRHERQP